MKCQAIKKKGGQCTFDAKINGYCTRHAKLQGSVDSKKPEEKKRAFTFTVTFCEVAENHAGMQKIGELTESGYSLEQIKNFAKAFQDPQIHDLSIEGYEACILVAKGGLNNLCDSSDFFEEQKALEKDTKAKMRGKVVNKHARQNLCFANYSQVADFQEGKGTIVDFKDVPVLSSVRDQLLRITGDSVLVAEGNYYIGPKTGIGFHGDGERRRVIGVRVGEPMLLRYVWFQRGIPICEPIDIMLEHGDIYFMSEKAVGNDWKSKKIPTLRHAAGHSSFLSWSPTAKQKATIEEALERGEDIPEFAQCNL